MSTPGGAPTTKLTPLSRKEIIDIIIRMQTAPGSVSAGDRAQVQLFVQTEAAIQRSNAALRQQVAHYGQLSAAQSAASREFGLLGRGLAAGLFGFSLLATTTVVAGRAIGEFVKGAIDAFRSLESEVANLATIQPQVDVSKLQEQIKVLQTELPASLKDIAEAYYQIGSAGGAAQEQNVRLTEQIVLGAKLARTDTKTWANDVMDTLNQFDMSYDRAGEVQAKFFQATKDSVTTGQQFAAALGPVVLAVQQLGGTLDDALALMVGASKGTGDFSQKMTLLTRVLQELQQTNTQKALRDYGIALQDADRNALPVPDILRQINARFKELGLTAAEQGEKIAEFFPQARGTRGAQLLLTQLDYIEAEYPKLQNANASYQQDLARYLDTNAAKMERTKALWDSFLESLGKAIDPINIVVNIVSGFEGEAQKSRTVEGVLQGFLLQSTARMRAGDMNAFGAITPVINEVFKAAGVYEALDRVQQQAMQKMGARQHQFAGATREDATTIKDAINEANRAYGTFAEQVSRHAADERASTQQSMNSWNQYAGTVIDRTKDISGALKGLTSDMETRIKGLSDWMGRQAPTTALEGQIGTLVASLEGLSAAADFYKSRGDMEMYRKTIEAIENQWKDLFDTVRRGKDEGLIDPVGTTNLKNDYAQFLAQRDARDAVTAAQKRLNDSTEYYRNLLEQLRQESQSLTDSQQSATTLISRLLEDANEAIKTGPGFETFRARAAAEIDKWLADEKAKIAGSGLPQAMQDTMLSAAQRAHDAMAQAIGALPAALGRAEAEWKSYIDKMKNDLEDLNQSIYLATQELTRMQRVLKDELQNPGLRPGTYLTSGSPYMPTPEQYQAPGNPAFLQVTPGWISKIVAAAPDAEAALAELRNEIEAPATGSGWLTQFENQVNALTQALWVLDRQAEIARRGFEQQSFAMGTEQYDLTQRRNAQMRPQEEQAWQLSQTLYQMDQATKMAVRPLDDALWELNRQYELEQDNLTKLERKYRDALNPLQREYNKLKREEQALAQADEMRNMREAMDNQVNTLTRLTPGTNSYLVVLRDLAKARGDFALKSKEYTLEDQIAAINEEKDAALDAEQRKLDAMGDTIKARQRERDLIVHNAELNRRSTQDALDDLNQRMSVENHEWDLEQRRLDDRKARLAEDQRIFEHNYTVQRNLISDRLQLAQLEQTWAERISTGWTNSQQAYIRGLSDEQTKLSNALSQAQREYDSWVLNSLNPALAAIKETMENTKNTIVDDYQTQINIISGPNGVIDKTQAMANETKKAMDAQVEAAQAYERELEGMYQMLDWINKFVQNGMTPPKYTYPTLPPGYIPVPGGPFDPNRKKEGQSNVPPDQSGTLPTGVGKATGGWVYPPAHAEWLAEREPELVIPASKLLTMARSNMGQSVTVGNITISGVGNDVSPAQAAEFGRRIVREIARQTGIVGTGAWKAEGYS